MKGAKAMYKRRCCVFPGVSLLVLLMIQPVLGAIESGETEQAAKIFKATGVQGGLVVHIGCGDGKLTTALGAREGYLVHGLDENAQAVRAARRHIRSLELCGKVTVEHFSGTHLPYIDNLVNLVVAENVAGLSMEQVMRILRPGGIAYVKNNNVEDIFQEILRNSLQKSLSLKLKKIYPLSLCEIRILKVEKR